MNHIDNTIPDTIDQIQHSDHQLTQAAHEDILALFARLKPQDVERFYQSYRSWNIQPRIQTLHWEIAELQQAIAHNTELMDQYQPSPIAQTILAQFQINGVNDLDLLDRMLVRGDDWLDHTMQLLEQCERLDIIHGNYTEWCEHALEGAYDWIDSMSEDDNTSVDSTESTPSSSEVFDESTEQLLLQKLLSEEEEVTQPSDIVEQPVSDTAPEELVVDASTELPTSVEALSDEAAPSTTSQPAQEGDESETELPTMPQSAQEEDEEKQTAEESSSAAISDTDILSAQELIILLPAPEADRANDEESEVDLVAVQSDTPDDIEVSGAEDDISEAIQQIPPTTEIITNATDNESLDTATTDVADLTHTANDTPDTETSEITNSIDSAELAAIEIEQNEPDIAEPAEHEPAAHRGTISQDSVSLQEEQLGEKTESTTPEATSETTDTIDISEPSNEVTEEGKTQDVVAEVSNVAGAASTDEEQQPGETAINAEEIIEPTAQAVAPTTDSSSVTPSAIDSQPETIQDDTVVETTITQEQEEVTLVQELSPAQEEDGEEMIEEHASEKKQAEPSPLPYPSNVLDSDEDTIAIPTISFLTSRITPPRVPAIAKADTQQTIPAIVTGQTPSPKEETTFSEVTTTIPNLQAVIAQASRLEVPVPAQLKEQTEATTVMARLPEPAASYTQPATRHYPTPIWQEYSTGIGNQPAPEVLPQPRPGFFRRLWLWFLVWLKG
jgi:hypothetical protein